MFPENGRIILLQVKVFALNVLFDEAFMSRLKAFFFNIKTSCGKKTLDTEAAALKIDRLPVTHTAASTLIHIPSPFLCLCLILTLQFRPLAGLRGEADASELVLVRLPPAHLQQAVHVPQGHLRSSAGSGSAFSTPLSHSGG